MSPEQLQRRNARVIFKQIKQEWNYDNPCQHCGCVHLKSAPANQRKLCCQGGKFVDNSDYPKLFELPIFLKNLMLERTEHLSPQSSYYNNIFCIAATGYDNGRKNIGCEHFNGPACLKMNGRAYHFIPNSSGDKTGGIANFTYDGTFQSEQQAATLNGNREVKRVDIRFVKGL